MSTLSKINVDDSITTVIDAGARYGPHPTWQDFEGALNYFAFEPDNREVHRLRQQFQRPGYEVLDLGLGNREGERDLNITQHRGCCSFLGIDPESEWFSRHRPGEGEIESVVRVKICTVDGFSSARGISPDFLKVDTEGTELEVLEGAEQRLLSSVMGVRVNVNFQPAYKGQALFPDIHCYLTGRNFFLLNMDYFGRGLPSHGLFRNPDPYALDQERYGVLEGTDAVWLKNYGQLLQWHRNRPDGLAYAVLKYAYFCILNYAPDVGVAVLERFLADNEDGFDQNVISSQIYLGVRKAYIKFLGRYRVYQDAQWDLAQATAKSIFDLNLQGGHEYWELVQNL